MKLRLFTFLLFFTAISTTIYAQETEKDSPAHSGTIPVMYINSNDGEPEITKESYIDATYWLDPLTTGVEALGSADAPLPLKIKGRGNSTWKDEKKSYKIKFEKKTAICGMPKSKHWALMAMHEHLMWLSNFMSRQLGEQMEMGWQTRMQPVELYLNGSYEGLYFISETVKIDSNRLDIYEQAEEEIDPDLITGGWLVEIDNYSDDYQIRVPETENMELWVTHKSPEKLSSLQKEWLINEFTNLNKLIYTDDLNDNTWEEYIDAESLAKYFIIQEIFDNTDGFMGSFYLHKDLKEGAKWVAGPLWDISFRIRERDDWTVNMPSWNNVSETKAHWIKELLKRPHFVATVREVWQKYHMDDLAKFYEILESYANPLEKAELANKNRWPTRVMSLGSKLRSVKTRFTYGYDFVESKLAKKAEGITLNSDSLSIIIGETAKLQATLSPYDAIDPLVWTSSDPDIFTIDRERNITGVSQGTAIVKAQFGDYVAECEVSVGISGIDVITSGGEKFYVWADGNHIKVNGAIIGDYIRLYKLDGELVCDAIASDETTTIQFKPMNNTVYILTIGNYSKKISF